VDDDLGEYSLASEAAPDDFAPLPQLQLASEWPSLVSQYYDVSSTSDAVSIEQEADAVAAAFVSDVDRLIFLCPPSPSCAYSLN
jgi:hypothetical protein